MKTVLVNVIRPKSEREDDSCGGVEQIRRCGQNTGNVCFVDAVSDQLDRADAVDVYKVASYGEKAVFVFPGSTWINKNNDMLKACFIPIENKDIQVAVIGLGIQGTSYETASDIVSGLQKETITALKILSEHSASIGVRGELTAEVLEKLGIHNYKIIGCPSFYEPYRKRQMKVCTDSDYSSQRVVFGMTPRAGNVNEHMAIELAYREENQLILQMMSDLPLTIFENLDIEQQRIDKAFSGLKLLPCELKAYIREKGRIFYSRKSWSEYLQEEEIVFAWGSRFHGNMMAFSNGIPALWIMHDGRTKEMIEAMGLPFITYGQLEKIKSVEELIEIPQYDGEFWKRYREMARQYVVFLNENSIEHTFADDLG